MTWSDEKPRAGRTSLDHYCDGIVTEATIFTKLLQANEFSGQIVTCPEWTPADLLTHVRQVLGWAEKIVSGRHLDLVLPDGVSELPDGLDFPTAVAELAKRASKTDPRSQEHRAQDLIDAAYRLSDVLREAGEETPIWAPATDHPVAGYWAHWARLEATLHRVDLELTLATPGHARSYLAPDVAIDILEGFLVSISRPETAPYYSPRRQGLNGNGETLSLAATDAPSNSPGHWSVTLTPDGVSWSHDEVSPAQVNVQASAGDLALLMKGRIPPHSPYLAVSGAYDCWTCGRRTPSADTRSRCPPTRTRRVQAAVADHRAGILFPLPVLVNEVSGERAEPGRVSHVPRRSRERCRAWHVGGRGTVERIQRPVRTCSRSARTSPVSTGPVGFFESRTPTWPIRARDCAVCGNEPRYWVARSTPVPIRRAVSSYGQPGRAGQLPVQRLAPQHGHPPTGTPCCPGPGATRTTNTPR